MANTPVGKRPPPLGETRVHYSTIRVKPLGGFGSMVLMEKGIRVSAFMGESFAVRFLNIIKRLKERKKKCLSKIGKSSDFD